MSAAIVHLTDDDTKELVVRNGTGVIDVEDFENGSDFFLIVGDVVVTHSEGNLLEAKGTATVSIHHVEGPAKSLNTSGATGSDLSSDSLSDFDMGFWTQCLGGLFSSLAKVRVSDDLGLHLHLFNLSGQRMSQNLLVAKSLPVEIMLVHRASIPVGLSRDLNIFNTSGYWLTVFLEVKGPHAYNEVSEVGISLNLSVNDSMPLRKVSKSDSGLVLESLVSAVERSEQIEKFKSGLVNCLDTLQDIRVPRWLELGLNLVKAQVATFVSVKVLESLHNQILSDKGQLLIQIIDKGRVVNLALFLKVVDAKGHLEVARLNIRDLEVIKSLQKFIQVQEAIAISIDQLKLALEADEATHAASVEALSKFLEQKIFLGVVACLGGVKHCEVLLGLGLAGMLLEFIIVVEQIEVIGGLAGHLGEGETVATRRRVGNRLALGALTALIVPGGGQHRVLVILLSTEVDLLTTVFWS